MSSTSDHPLRTIASERVTLRPFDASDAQSFREIVEASRQHLLPWEPWAAQDRSAAHVAEDLASLHEAFVPVTSAHYAIVHHTRGLVGSVASVVGPEGEDSSGCPEIGCWLAAHATGNGLATEAVTALVSATFAHRHANVLQWWAEPANERSIALARRCGFTYLHDATSHWHSSPEAPLMQVWQAERELWSAR